MSSGLRTMNKEAESVNTSPRWIMKIKKKLYKEKLSLEGERIPDPYALPDEGWTDDDTKWLTVLYGGVYNYLIESKGRYTQQSLRAFKS